MLRTEIYYQLLHNPKLQGKIMFETGVTFSTLTNWARGKKDRLERVQIIKIIADFLETTPENLFNNN